VQGDFLRINIKGTSTVNILLEFLYNDSGDKASIEKIYWAFYDIDGGRENQEVIRLENFYRFLTPANPNYDIDYTEGNDWVEVRNRIVGNVPNPTDYMSLSEEQENVSMAVEYRNVDSISMRLTATQVETTSRNINFASVQIPIGTDFCKLCSESGLCSTGYLDPDLLCHNGITNNCNAETCECISNGSELMSFGDPIVWTYDGECYDLNIDGRYLASSHKTRYDYDVYISVYNHYMREIQVAHRVTGEIMLSINNFGEIINNYPYYFIQESVKCENAEDCDFFFIQFVFDAQQFEYVVQIQTHQYEDPALEEGETGVHLDIYPHPYPSFDSSKYNGLYFQNPIPNQSGICRP